MKKLTIILTIFLLGILTAFLVSAIDFTPKGDIDMQGYSIKGAKNISATGNVSANWLFAFLNWSNVQNAPTNSWLSTYNATYATWLPNWTSFNVYWYNMTTPAIDYTDHLTSGLIIVNGSSHILNETDPIASATIIANNNAWLSTYNATYDAGSIWWYNQTSAAYDLWNSIWTATYNATYHGLISSKVPYTGADKTVYLNNQSLIIQNTKGNNVTLNNFVEHTQEMMTDTLLDKSRSTISIVNGVVNFTLFAVYGCGQFNFGGVLYPTSGNPCVANATITLLNGSAQNPKTNYIHWYLNAGVPTMTTTESYPAYEHIDVGTFVIGNTSGTTANIYSYSRNRYEVDTLVKRVIERFEESGTLYVSGLEPNANTSNVNITTGEFFNGIFEMSTTNIVQLRQNGFYYINGTGNFVEANSLASFTQYANGVAFAGGANERVNIIWGIVPINTTGGTGPTQARLVAVLPTYQGTGNEYTSVSSAITDNFDTANYFPPNSEIKAVFTPVMRTILRPSTDLFEPFVTGRYYQDIRGKVTNGGSSASSSSSNHAVLDNLDYASSGHTGFVPVTGIATNVNLGVYNISAGNQYSFAGGGYIYSNSTTLVLGHT